MKLRSRNVQIKRIAQCAGKERFASFTTARRVASKFSHSKGSAMQAYPCRHCGGFHIGTPSGEGRGVSIDTRQPFRVFAHNGDRVECFIGRSNKSDGGKLKEIIAKDGWEVTRVVK